MKVYYISGLGADETVFQFLKIKNAEPIFLHWLPPFKSETLEAYAIRFKNAYIPDHAVVIGMSFGGMIATEIAKQFPHILSILVSSVKIKSEFPLAYNLGKYLPIHRWVPGRLQRWFMLHSSRLFGADTEKAKDIYQKIIEKSDVHFNTWALDSIINWKNKIAPSNCIHIHGTSDHIIPHRNVHSDYEIKGGSHLMIINEAEEISNIINKIIEGKYCHKD